MSSGRDVSDSGPGVLKELSPEQQVRLTEILDGYLAALENHEQPQRDELLEAHPELAIALGMYLEKLDELYGVRSQSLSGAAPLSGQTLGDYVLVEEIGRGGMGLVFSAENKKLGRKVALKLLPMAALLDEKHIERFKNEARAAANLQHPNIVPVYSIGEEGGIHYFAMRLIDGPSLDRRIAEHVEAESEPPIQAVLKQFVDIADALHAAHEHGIVHRDIKPSNLLLDSSNQLWIADFGLARCGSDASLTRTGEMVGTVRYMSPEQATGRGELVDHRTDIYSLGATLFELLTLQPVIEGEDSPSLLRKIESQPVPRIGRLRSDCSRDLQTVLDKAMARRKEDRYASAADFSSDLQCLVRGNPVSARPLSPAVHVARWAARNSTSLAVTCMILLIATLGLVVHNTLVSSQFNLAQQNLDGTRSAVEEMYQTTEQLALIPGCERVRGNLLQSILRYYQGFTQQAAGDASLRSDVARAYTRIAAISEEFGDPKSAIAAYRRAEKIYVTLLRDGDSQPGVSLLRNRNLNHLGIALSNSGETQTAVDTLSQEVARQREAVAAAQTPPTHLAFSLNNLGLTLLRAGRIEQAKSAYQEAIKLLETAHTAATDNAEITRGLAAAHQNIGSLSQASPELARKSLYRALELQLSLADQPTGRLKISRDLISTYLHLGTIELSQKSGKAKSHFHKASLIAQQLVEISPDVAGYRRDFAISLSNLGMSLFQEGQSASALDSLQRSVQQYRKLLEQRPDNTDLLGSLGVALNNAATVLRDLGHDQDADLAYREAARSLVLANAGAQQNSHRQLLGKIYHNHAQLLSDAGRDDEAQVIARRQLELATMVRETNNDEGSN